jgi:hypothetical protein
MFANIPLRATSMKHAWFICLIALHCSQATANDLISGAPASPPSMAAGASSAGLTCTTAGTHSICQAGRFLKMSGYVNGTPSTTRLQVNLPAACATLLHAELSALGTDGYFKTFKATMPRLESATRLVSSPGTDSVIATGYHCNSGDKYCVVGDAWIGYIDRTTYMVECLAP